MSDVTFKINNREITVPAGTTVLEAARMVNVSIPTLCYLRLHDFDAVNQCASCRVCLVEMEGRGSLVPACATYAATGMSIRTNSPRAIIARRTMVELLLSDHPFDCLVCEKNRSCDLQRLASELGIRGEIEFKGEMSTYKKDASSHSLYRNLDKCIMCRRCETMCNQVQTCGILSAQGRGFGTVVGPAMGLEMKDTMCTFCGQCVSVCPTAALTQINNIRNAWTEIINPDRFVVVQTAPAVRVALGEEFGMEPGTNVTGKMVTLLRELGFDRVFDTDFGADLTIMEEAHEIIERLSGGGRLPILTSCCPAWVKFIEHQFPELLDVPSTCKSPHEMFGAVAKSYFAEKEGIDPSKITVVSVMPCLAKKYEVTRGELRNTEAANVDIVLTTRELALMATEAGVDFLSLPDSDFDTPLGESTGASVIFGVTGGVIEAALRTAHEMITGKELEDVEFRQLRGFHGLREADVQVGDRTLKVGIAHGLGNARRLLESIRDGESRYDAIEIMACPGGCICGGGQPYHHGNMEIARRRMEAIYAEDRSKKRRKSHENDAVAALYRDYLGEVGGKKAHELLHTGYTAREFI